MLRVRLRQGNQYYAMGQVFTADEDQELPPTKVREYLLRRYPIYDNTPREHALNWFHLGELLVSEFHYRFRHPVLPPGAVNDTPAEDWQNLQDFRLGFAKEEERETRELGFDQNDWVEVADGIADMAYVAYGTRLALGEYPYWKPHAVRMVATTYNEECLDRALKWSLQFGLPFWDLFILVHEANMAKVWPDGTVHYIVKDGVQTKKVEKPPGWVEPNGRIRDLLEGFHFPL